jgi:Cu-processing system permease protein
MSALEVARWTVKEAVRRRLLLGLVLLSAAFVGLFGLGFALLYNKAQASSGADAFVGTVAANVLTVLGLYAVQFLAAFLALFLSVGAISADADSGLLHAVLARPISRRNYLLGRWLAFAGLLVVYVLGMAGALLLIARTVADYQPVSPVRTLGLLTLEVVFLVSVGMLGSTVLPTLGNGVLTFSLFGLAWLGGIIELIGSAVHNVAMANIGTGVALAFPSDALWRGASYFAQSPAFLAQTSAVGQVSGGIPFASTSAPKVAIVAWAAAYLLVVLALARAAFARRDL